MALKFIDKIFLKVFSKSLKLSKPVNRIEARIKQNVKRMSRASLKFLVKNIHVDSHVEISRVLKNKKKNVYNFGNKFLDRINFILSSSFQHFQLLSIKMQIKIRLKQVSKYLQFNTCSPQLLNTYTN